MTDERRKALADRLLAEHIYHVDYIRGTVALLSLLLVLYGGLTWVVGDDLWNGADIYQTALRAPGAPQSWGAVFISIGTTLIWAALRRRYRWIWAISLVAALVLGMFMITFGVEYFDRSNESSRPATLGWGVFSLMFLNLSRMAAKLRTLEMTFAAQTKADEPYTDV